MKKIVSLATFVTAGILLIETCSCAEKQKDHLNAFLLSFLVPGLGQYYAGSPGAARRYAAMELALWSGYYYTTCIKQSYRNDYLGFAAAHAGINPEGYGASFINAIGAFDTSFEYNNYQLQVKDNPVQYTGMLSWEWDTYENRQHFGKLRERELDYENYTKYCIAGVILNHFLAGLNASKLVKKQTNRISAMTVYVLDDGLAARYIRTF